ncbi:hypothetical protein K1719_029636 [Acacia pycnantha]|nr:hypothetical protein K1719_029636 [Acacia pycnantha]
MIDDLTFGQIYATDQKDKEKNRTETDEKLQLREEDEEKEQCSPMSVLDPPFENDDEGHEKNYEDDGFDLECSYAILQIIALPTTPMDQHESHDIPDREESEK